MDPRDDLDPDTLFREDRTQGKSTQRLDLEIIVDDEAQDFALVGDLDEIDAIFGELGGEVAPAPLGPRERSERELDRARAELEELHGMLNAMRPMGEELAALSKELARAEEHALARERELEQLRGQVEFLREALGERAEEDELVRLREERARLERRAERLAARVRGLTKRRRALTLREIVREGVLARERARHAATRAKLVEARRIAAERWRELRRRSPG